MVRQYNQFISLMSNYDFFEENVQRALNATGTLTKQHEIYTESWEAASTQVKASIQGVYDSIIDDKWLIKATNNVAKFISGFDQFIDSIGGLKTIIPAIGSVFLMLFANKIPEALQNIGYNIGVLSGQAYEKAAQTYTIMKEQIALQLELAQNSELYTAQETQQLKTDLAIIEIKEKMTLNQDKLTESEKKMVENTILELDNQNKLIQAIQEKRKLLADDTSSQAAERLGGRFFGTQETVEKSFETSGLEAKSKDYESKGKTQSSHSINKFGIDLQDLGVQMDSIVSDEITKMLKLWQNGGIKSAKEFWQALQDSFNKEKGSAAVQLQTKMLELFNQTFVSTSQGGGKADGAYGWVAEGLEVFVNQFSNLAQDTEIQNALKNLQPDTNGVVPDLGKIESAIGLIKNKIQQVDEAGEKVGLTFENITSNPNFTLAFKPFMANADSLSGYLETFSKNFDDYLKDVQRSLEHNVKFSESISSIVGSLGTFAFGLNNVRGAWDALTNSDLSWGEKVSELFVSLSTGIPTVIGGLNIFAKSISDISESFNASKKGILLDSLGDTLSNIKLGDGGDAIKNQIVESFKKGGTEGALKALDSLNLDETAFNKIKESLSQSVGVSDILAKSFSKLKATATSTLGTIGKAIASFVTSPAGIAVLAVAAIGTALYTVYKHAQNYDPTQIYEKQKAALEDYQTAADEAAQKVKDFTSEFSAYETAVEKTKDLTNGTTEMSDAIAEANQQAQDLIDKYNSLQGKWHYENGVITFDEGVEEEASSMLRQDANSKASQLAYQKTQTQKAKADNAFAGLDDELESVRTKAALVSVGLGAVATASGNLLGAVGSIGGIFQLGKTYLAGGTQIDNKALLQDVQKDDNLQKALIDSDIDSFIKQTEDSWKEYGFYTKDEYKQYLEGNREVLIKYLNEYQDEINGSVNKTADYQAYLMKAYNNEDISKAKFSGTEEEQNIKQDALAVVAAATQAENRTESLQVEIEEAIAEVKKNLSFSKADFNSVTSNSTYSTSETLQELKAENGETLKAKDVAKYYEQIFGEGTSSGKDLKDLRETLIKKIITEALTNNQDDISETQLKTLQGVLDKVAPEQAQAITDAFKTAMKNGGLENLKWDNFFKQFNISDVIGEANTTNPDEIISNLLGLSSDDFNKVFGSYAENLRNGLTNAITQYVADSNKSFAEERGIIEGSKEDWARYAKEVLGITEDLSNSSIEEIRKVIDEAEQARDKAINTAQSVINMDGIFDSLSDAYEGLMTSISEQDLSILSINSSLGKSITELEGGKVAFEEFSAAVYNANGDLELTQQAFNRLATFIVESTLETEGMTDATKSSAAARLEAMGVTNAAEVVEGVYQEKLRETTDLEKLKAEETLNAAISTGQLSSSIPDLITALGQEGWAADNAKAKIVELALEQFNFVKSKLDLSQQVSALKDIAIAAGISEEKIKNVSDAMKSSTLYAKVKEQLDAGEITAAQARRQYQNIDVFAGTGRLDVAYLKAVIEKEFAGVTGTGNNDTPSAVYKPVTSSSSSSGSSSSSKERETKTFEEEESEKEELERYYKINSQIEKLTANYDELDEAKENLSGSKYVDALEEEIDVMQDIIDATDDYISEIDAWTKKDISAFNSISGDMGLSVTISSLDELGDKYLSVYNAANKYEEAAVNAYNTAMAALTNEWNAGTLSEEQYEERLKQINDELEIKTDNAKKLWEAWQQLETTQETRNAAISTNADNKRTQKSLEKEKKQYVRDNQKARKKDVDIKTHKSERDIYYEINQQIEKQEQLLKDINAAKSDASGQDYINLLKREEAEQEKLIALKQCLASIAQQEGADNIADFNNLASSTGIGIQVKSLEDLINKRNLIEDAIANAKNTAEEDKSQRNSDIWDDFEAGLIDEDEREYQLEASKEIYEKKIEDVESLTEYLQAMIDSESRVTDLLQDVADAVKEKNDIAKIREKYIKDEMQDKEFVNREITDEEPERYTEISMVLEKTSRILSEVSAKKDEAFGKRHIDLLNTEIACYDTIIDSNKTLLKQAEDYTKIDISAFTDQFESVFGTKLNIDPEDLGDWLMSNSEDIEGMFMEKSQEIYDMDMYLKNMAAKEYNESGKTDEDKEKAEQAIKEADLITETSLETLETLKEHYYKSVDDYQAAEDAKTAIAEAERNKRTKEVEIFNYKINLINDTADFQQEYLDWLKELSPYQENQFTYEVMIDQSKFGVAQKQVEQSYKEIEEQFEKIFGADDSFNADEWIQSGMQLSEEQLDILQNNAAVWSAIQSQVSVVADAIRQMQSSLNAVTEDFIASMERGRAEIDEYATSIEFAVESATTLGNVQKLVGGAITGLDKINSLTEYITDGEIKATDSAITKWKTWSGEVVETEEEAKAKLDGLLGEEERLVEFSFAKRVQEVASYIDYETQTRRETLKNYTSMYINYAKLKQQAEDKYQLALKNGNEAEIEQQKKVLDTVMDYFKEAQSEWQGYMEDFYNSVYDSFKEKMELMISEFDRSFSVMTDSYEKLNSLSEDYLTTFQEAYETNKLNADIQKSINETKNVKSKKELLALQEKINERKKQERPMTDYEVQALRKQYELKLAMQALDEAKNAKSQVRLTKDENGNLGYMYTADDTEVANAQQDLNDKLSEYYNFNLERTQELSNIYIELVGQMEDEILNLSMDQFSSVSDYNKAIDNIRNFYAQKLEFISAETEVALSNNNDLSVQYQESLAAFGVTVANMVTTFQDTNLAQSLGVKDSTEVFDEMRNVLFGDNGLFLVIQDEGKLVFETLTAAIDDTSTQLLNYQAEMAKVVPIYDALNGKVEKNTEVVEKNDGVLDNHLLSSGGASQGLTVLGQSADTSRDAFNKLTEAVGGDGGLTWNLGQSLTPFTNNKDKIEALTSALTGEDGNGGAATAASNLKGKEEELTDTIKKNTDAQNKNADSADKVKNSYVGEDGNGGAATAASNLKGKEEELTDTIKKNTDAQNKNADSADKVKNSYVGEDGNGGVSGALGKVKEAFLGSEGTGGILGAIGQVVGGLTGSDGIVDASGQVVGGLTGSDGIVDASGQVVGGLTGSDGILSALGATTGGLIGGDGTGGILGATSSWDAALSGIIDTSFPNLGQGFENVQGNITDTIPYFVGSGEKDNSSISGAANTSSSYFEKLKGASSKLGSSLQALSNYIPTATNTFKTTLDPQTDATKGKFKLLDETVKNLNTKFGTGTKTALTNWGKCITETFAETGDNYTTFSETMGNMSDDYLGVTDEVEKLGTNVSTVGKQVSDQVFKTDNIEGVGDEADNTSKDIKDLQEEIEGLKKKVGENYSTDNLTSLQEKYEATSNKVQTVWNKVNALHDKVKQTFTTSTIESLTGKYKGLTEAVKNAIAAVQSLSPDGNGSQGANGAAATGAITGSYKGKNGGLNTPEIVSNALKVEFLKSLLSEHYGESGLTVGFARHVLRTAMGFDEQPGKGTMTYTLMDTDVDGKDISVADSRIALRAAIGLDNEQLIEWANAVWDRGAKQGLYSGNSAVVKTGAWKIDALPQEDEDYLQTVAKTLAEKQAVINAATAIAAQLDTGGYTGEWDSSGRLAVLHQKEIVLNKYDTSNFLSGIEVLREISKAIDLQAISAQMAQSSAFTALRLPTSMVQPVQQDVHISASFPNVNDSREIEAALENLVNEAVQYTSQQF